MKDPAFLQDVAEVCKGKYFSNANDLIDTFFADKTARYNSVSLAKDYVTLCSQRSNQRKDGKDQEVYDRFPNFWEEGGRSAFDALSDAVPAAILNHIPIGKAAQVGRQAAKLGKSAFLAGAKDGAVKLAAAEGAIAGGFATVDEFDRVETGQQDEISGGRIALEAILGGTLGGVLGGAIGGIAAKISNTQVTQIVARKAFLEEQIPNLDGQELNDAVAEIGQINRILDEVLMLIKT